MTDEMEPVDEATQFKRKIDHSLARFSAAHDELAAEEEERKKRRERLTARPAQLFEQTRTRLQRVARAGAAVAPTRFTRAPDIGSDEEFDEFAQQDEDEFDDEKPPLHNERFARTARIVAAVVAGLVFLSTGALWGTKTWFNNKFNEIAALDENSSDIQNAAGQRGDENFLIVGSDTRAGAQPGEDVGNEDGVPGARSDTIMLAHIPADRQRAIVVSFPRDLEISRPECDRWDPSKADYTQEKVPADKNVKLNTSYAVGGPKCTLKWIQQLSGLKINHFIGIDFNGFKGMVDAVHGVDVQVDKPIDDSVLGMVISQTGNVTISGDQALSYVRARHVKGDPTSDYGRIKRQQDFIGSLMKKVMSHGVLTDPTQLSDFVTAFAGATFGDNIGVDQMLTLAQSMRGLDPGKVDFMTVPTTGESNSRGNEVLLQQKAAAVFRSMIDNTPMPADGPPPPPAGSSSGTPTVAAEASAPRKTQR
jgi:LCP family protein required for cell wall assembly